MNRVDVEWKAFPNLNERTWLDNKFLGSGFDHSAAGFDEVNPIVLGGGFGYV